ncbi:MAG: restriction endonuclease subunit S [Verrucomicrobiales bacterium]|nr:restriction endonuclease subunit S [Verrucomicrobiales bacterium]
MSKQWPKAKLGEVLRRVERFETRDELTEYPFAGTYSFARGIFVGERKLGSTFALPKIQRIRAGDFIYCKIMAWEGAFGIAPKEADNCVMSGAFVVYELNRERLDEKFLDCFFKVPDHWQSMGRQSTGTNVRRQSLHPTQFERAEIPLPPLAEQRRVMARIEELAPKIHEARTLRQRAVAEAELVYPSQLAACMEPHGPGWRRETVADVIASMDAGWSPQCDNIPAREGAWGVLKTTAVQWCKFWPHQNKALPQSVKPIPELAVQEGDVLVTRAGPRKRVAVVAAVRNDESRLTISDKLIRLRPYKEKIDYRFLELSLAAPFSQEHLVQRKTGLADAQVNISQAILKATPVAYPPITEQRRIVEYLDGLQSQVNELRRLQSETAAELDAMLPAVLDRAFNGEL